MGGAGHDAAAGGNRPGVDVEEADLAVARIRQQMLLMWAGVVGLICCCVGGRAVQVVMRRRSRDRKKRDVQSKHSV
jgi:hypothetical protein